MDIHNQLGPGLLEIVYKDAFEYELKNANIPFKREKEFVIYYNGINLPHKFNADFIVIDKIILEVKVVSDITNVFIAQSNS